MRNLSIFSFLLCLLLCFAACEGPMGEPGLDGEDGIDGVDGRDGEDGMDGEDGRDGNANVKAYQFNIDRNDFSEDNTNTWYVWHQIPNANITLNDAVLVYFYQGFEFGSHNWEALPFNNYFNTSNSFNHFSYQIASDNYLKLTIRNSNGLQPYTTMSSGAFSYRAIIAKGTYGGKQALDTNIDLSSLKCHELNEYLSVPEYVDLCDYEQAKVYFELAE